MKKEKSKETVEDVRAGSETILLVDDEEIIITLVESLLSGNGYKVLTARDGLEALAIYSEHQKEIALVLSDIGMPKLNGYDLFYKLKETNPSVRVIIGSGYFDANTKTELLKVGVKDFIQKPYVLDEILKKVRDVLDQQ